MTKKEMIQEILIAVKTSMKTPITGDLVFALAFRTEKELKTICAKLNINTGA